MESGSQQTPRWREMDWRQLMKSNSWIGNPAHRRVLISKGFSEHWQTGKPGPRDRAHPCARPLTPALTTQIPPNARIGCLQFRRLLTNGLGEFFSRQWRLVVSRRQIQMWQKQRELIAIKTSKGYLYLFGASQRLIVRDDYCGHLVVTRW